ncbi:MAG: hypothetical protein HY690_09650 [Chloroflexi bacterium]|nr:hypothetical protein [Chloroflexota bacterium]
MAAERSAEVEVQGPGRYAPWTLDLHLRTWSGGARGPPPPVGHQNTRVQPHFNNYFGGFTMPLGEFINIFPPAFFLVVHLVAFAIGAFFAYRSFEAEASLLGWGFALFALAEISYMTYHLNWTVFLFAHTISEVLDLVAFILIFAAASQRVLSSARARA